MDPISEKLEKIVVARPVRDSKKLQAQQAYYQRLVKAGIAKKQPYNIKPLSVI